MHASALIKRYISLILFASFAMAPFAHSDPISIDLQPSVIGASTGDSISFDLVISGLEDSAPDSLGAFDISVGFDDSALSFSSYSLGSFLGDVGLSEAIDASSGALGGSVNVAEVSLLSAAGLDALQPGSFTLATLNFDVTSLALGAVTQLSLMPGGVLGDGFGASLTLAGSGVAAVSNVPLPGTLMLLASTLFGWLTWVRPRPKFSGIR